MKLSDQQYADLVKRIPQRSHVPAAFVPKAAPKKHKYNAEQTLVDGIKFASKLEARYYQQLLIESKSVRARQLREGKYWKVGDLLWFTRQVEFELEGGVKYIADFQVVKYWDTNRNIVEWIDTKGQLLQGTKNKLKQVKDRYGIDVQIVTDDQVMKVSV
jgi:hypothetical protein